MLNDSAKELNKRKSSSREGICNKCGTDSRYKSGECKKCKCESSKIWRKKNKEKCVKYVQEYRKRNIEKCDEYAKQYYEKNKEKINQEKREKYQNNKDGLREYIKSKNKKYKEYRKEWAQKNKEKIIIYMNTYKYKNIEKYQARSRLAAKNRRAQKKATGKLSKDIVEKLMKLQKGKCACCGEKLKGDFHIDHIIPLALGGENIDSNVQLLLPKCNIRKSAKHPIDYMQSKGFLL